MINKFFRTDIFFIQVQALSKTNQGQVQGQGKRRGQGRSI